MNIFEIILHQIFQGFGKITRLKLDASSAEVLNLWILGTLWGGMSFPQGSPQIILLIIYLYFDP